MKVVNYDWIEARVAEAETVTGLDVTISTNIVAKALIVALSKCDIPFKIYNIGAGVKRITTVTDTCPCCKRRNTND